MRQCLNHLRTLLAYSIVTATLAGVVFMWRVASPGDPGEALLAACSRGDVTDIDRALARGARVNSRSDDDLTGLFCAARAGHLDAVQRLLERGADANAAAPGYGTPLMAAAMFDHAQVAGALLAQGALVDRPNDFGNRPLFFAAASGSAALVEALLTAGATVDSRNHRGLTPLMNAVLAENREAVRSLLAAGADPFATDDGGVTPTMLAAGSPLAGLLEGGRCEPPQPRAGPSACRDSSLPVPCFAVVPAAFSGEHLAKSEPIEIEATVSQALPNAMFKLRLDNSEREILGIVSGKMRKHFIRILPGDRVKVELSPYDLTKGRIVFRQK